MGSKEEEIKHSKNTDVVKVDKLDVGMFKTVMRTLLVT